MKWNKEIFENKLKIIWPNLKLVSDIFLTLRDYVEVEDDLGIIYSSRGQTLLKNYPSIQSALNKTEAFKIKAKNIHKDLFNYDKSIYINSNTKLIITCKKCGDFEQTPSLHLLQKHGCPVCSKGVNTMIKNNWVEYTKNKKCILYIIYCFDENENFIKIGITSNNVKYRYLKERDLPYKYESIFEYVSIGDTIWELEKLLHNLYTENLYVPAKYFSGITECFNSSILEELILKTKNIINEKFIK